MDAVDLFKALVWDNLVKAILARWLAKIPLLGWGPIAAVITHFVLKYSDELYEGIVLFIDLQKIAFKNQQLQKEFDTASVSLRIIARGYGWQSTEFEEARVERKKHLSQFIKFDVARAS